MSRIGETPEQRRERLKSKGGWIAVDLDGTLAEYHGWGDGNRPDGPLIGKAIPVMVNRVKGWLAEGMEVRIFTARAGHPDHNESSLAAIHAWCLENIGVVLPVCNVKDHKMIEVWDDRAVQVERNTGRRMDGQP